MGTLWVSFTFLRVFNYFYVDKRVREELAGSVDTFLSPLLCFLTVRWPRYWTFAATAANNSAQQRLQGCVELQLFVPINIDCFLVCLVFFFYICGNLISMWVFRSVTDETLCFKELFLIITRNVFVLMTCFSSRQTDPNLPPVVQLSGVDRVPGIWPECLVSCSSSPLPTPPIPPTPPFWHWTFSDPVRAAGSLVYSSVDLIKN